MLDGVFGTIKGKGTSKYPRRVLTEKVMAVDVRDLLFKHPETRDNDQMLVSLTWFYHIGRDEVKSLSAWDLLTKLSKNKLPNAESIRRCRQKLQEHDEDLRGKKYKERHKLECEVKEEIKNWTGELF